MAMLVIINAMIIYEATRYDRSQQQQQQMQKSNSNKRKLEMSRSIVIITFSYILLTLPGAIINGYFYVTLTVYDYGQIIINFFGCISFTFPAFNFFTLFFTNKMFAKEFKSIFLAFKYVGNNQVTTVPTNSTVNRTRQQPQKTNQRPSSMANNSITLNY